MGGKGCSKIRSIMLMDLTREFQLVLGTFDTKT